MSYYAFEEDAYPKGELAAIFEKQLQEAAAHNASTILPSGIDIKKDHEYLNNLRATLSYYKFD